MTPNFPPNYRVPRLFSYTIRFTENLPKNSILESILCFFFFFHGSRKKGEGSVKPIDKRTRYLAPKILSGPKDSITDT